MKTHHVKAPTSGMALVITLTMLVLATIIIVGMINMTRVEHASAQSTFEAERAKALNDLAADHALALIRESITAAEATVPIANAAARKFWASQPGKITVFNADGSIDTTNSKNLYTTSGTSGAPVVDLNAPLFDGSHPIISDDGTGSAPKMEVAWVHLLKDPSAVASGSNPVIGRYAFWVDDESTKLNISTADGSVKTGTKSFGPGTPAEMNLTVLTNGTAGNLTEAQAAAIAQRSGAQYDPNTPSQPFNSIHEILKVPGITEDLLKKHGQDLTAYNTAPELNIFGEPRIYLTTAVPTIYADTGKATSLSLTLAVGPYADVDPLLGPAPLLPEHAPRIIATGRPLTWLYPSSSQLPSYQYTSNGSATNTTVPLPQFFRDELWPWITSTVAPKNHPAKHYPDHGIDYELGMRIARYLKGWNSQGNPLQWPTFNGANVSGFAEKYTDRQIDDITVQILSFLKHTHADHYYNYTLPYFMPGGFLSNKPIRGNNRGPRLTELVMIVDVDEGDPPLISIKFVTEFYLPKEFGGSDLTYGELNLLGIRLNKRDLPLHSTNSTPPMVTGESKFGGYWADTMLQITAQDGLPAGVDLFGNPATKPDPSQEKAALYRTSAALKNPAEPHNPVTNPYMGDIATPFDIAGRPVFTFNHALPGSPQSFKTWNRGDYLASVSSGRDSRSMKPGVTSVTIGGGLTIWFENSSHQPVEGVPLDSLFPRWDQTLTNDQKSQLLAAVLPIPGTETERTIQVPGRKVFHFQVADPLVNSFPGDWKGSVLPSASSPEITMPAAVVTGNSDKAYYTNGLNTISKPSEEGDYASIWWPEQNIKIPKSRRFPSSGYLQYIRTGAMPDKIYEPIPPAAPIPLSAQKGTPWRSLNLSPSTSASQETRGLNGATPSFPDWAILDLFTTPALFQPLGTPLPPPIFRTWGGATAGRLNPNAVLEPFGIERTKPLEALFKDVPVSTEYKNDEPDYKTVNEATVARAVTAYIKALGRPLMMIGEICNVPEMDNYTYKDTATSAQTRNDLLRQTIGNLTTKSNTFSVWAISESIKKKPGNTHYDIFEPGDAILSQSRMRYVIERYLDPGSDNVYGNAITPAPDSPFYSPPAAPLNTPLDPVTTGSSSPHPRFSYPLPYKYRIVSATQIE